MASHVQVFSPHTLQSSAFCSVKKLKVEPSSNWDMTGYGSHSKVYSQSKNIPPSQPATTTVSTSLPIPNPSLPYEQTIIFPGSTGHIVVTSASSTSVTGQVLGGPHNLMRRSTVSLLDTYQKCGLKRKSEEIENTSSVQIDLSWWVLWANQPSVHAAPKGLPFPSTAMQWAANGVKIFF